MSSAIVLFSNVVYMETIQYVYYTSLHCPFALFIVFKCFPDATLPDYIPQKSTLRHIFTTCIDIKAVPKKASHASLSFSYASL